MLRLSLVLMLLFPAPVRAEFQDGNTLYANCNKEEVFFMAFAVVMSSRSATL